MDRPISKTRLLEIASNPSSDKYEDDIGQLVSWGLYQGLLYCDGFAIKPASCIEGYESLDQLALDYLENAEAKSEDDKLAFLRRYLKNVLSDPSESTPSFYEWSIDVGTTQFIICVLVVIEGYEPVAVDYFAVRESKEVVLGLCNRGYLINDGDVDSLTDGELLALWK